MRQLEPTGEPIDSFGEVVALLANDAPPPPEVGCVVTSNMVMSLDGAYSAQGVSGALSSEADHRLFIANRMLADVILVGAGTARAERYRRPKVAPEAAEVRERRGQDPYPRLVIVSRSLDVGADSPLLTGDGPPPILAHPQDADTSRAPKGFDLMALPGDGTDSTQLIEQLTTLGARRVTCEGGPHLLGQLAGAGLVDEYLLTISPLLIGGEQVGLLGAVNIESDRANFELHRVLRDGDHLLCSYRRTKPT